MGARPGPRGTVLPLIATLAGSWCMPGYIDWSLRADPGTICISSFIPRYGRLSAMAGAAHRVPFVNNTFVTKQNFRRLLWLLDGTQIFEKNSWIDTWKCADLLKEFQNWVNISGFQKYLTSGLWKSDNPAYLCIAIETRPNRTPNPLHANQPGRREPTRGSQLKNESDHSTRLITSYSIMYCIVVS
jgi:hypothetical protein